MGKETIPDCGDTRDGEDEEHGEPLTNPDKDSQRCKVQNPARPKGFTVLPHHKGERTQKIGLSLNISPKTNSCFQWKTAKVLKS